MNYSVRQKIEAVRVLDTQQKKFYPTTLKLQLRQHGFGLKLAIFGLKLNFHIKKILATKLRFKEDIMLIAKNKSDYKIPSTKVQPALYFLRNALNKNSKFIKEQIIELHYHKCTVQRQKCAYKMITQRVIYLLMTLLKFFRIFFLISEQTGKKLVAFKNSQLFTMKFVNKQGYWVPWLKLVSH